MIGRAQPQIESITGERFDCPTYPEILDLVKSYESFSVAAGMGQFPGYRFLVRLRHHGFPSPLLDWTRSMNVAAFFAFAPPAPTARRRAIYLWVPARSRVLGTERPELTRLGPYVTTHRRQVLQQADYSVCPTFASSEKEWRFTRHEDVLASDDGPSPNRLWKFTIPSTERLKVLGELDGMNVNAYSLFGAEESLLDTISLREMELHKS